MKLQIIGYDSLKDGQYYVLHCVDLTVNGRTVGYRPLIVSRLGKVNEGLFVTSKQFTPTKEDLSKVIDVEFNASGRVNSIVRTNK